VWVDLFSVLYVRVLVNLFSVSYVWVWLNLYPVSYVVLGIGSLHACQPYESEVRYWEVELLALRPVS